MAQKYKSKALNITIPANSPANVAIQKEFKHDLAGIKKGVAFGLSTIKNPNNKHFNFGMNIIDSEPTIDPVSKNFYEASAASAPGERFIALEFDKPTNDTSIIKLVPTEASGADDIVVQVVFKYEVN